MMMIGRVKNGRVTFAYRCECADCDEAGELVLMAGDRGTVACPSGCGAVYVPWLGPDRKWQLINVMMPVEEDGPPHIGGRDEAQPL
jgi:hypothetical protein